MSKDFLKKEPTKQQINEYRFQAMEHDLINLQRQVATLARVMGIEPEKFIEALNKPEEHEKYIKDLNAAYAKFSEAAKAEQDKPAEPTMGVPAMPEDESK